MQKKLQQYVVFLVSILTGALFPSMLFAYEAAPVAITSAATFITEKSAQLNAQGNPNEVADSLGWFEWGISGRQGTIYETPHLALRSTRNTLTKTNAKLVGLAPSTQYFYRYIVESSRGKNIGQTVYFTTKPRAVTLPLVIIETNSAASITNGSVELRGYVSPHGDANTTAWFQWGTTQQVEFETPRRKVSGNAASINVMIKNLTPGTLYFYRAVAENSTGQTQGVTRVFITTGIAPPPSEQPVSQTVPVTGVKSDGVERNGAVTSENNTKSRGNVFSSGSKNIPQNVFSNLLRKKSTTNTSANGSSGADDGSNQVAGAGAASPLGVFWNNLTGKNLIEVSVEKVGPSVVKGHTPVEYLVSYKYGESAAAENARLSITFPKNVIYIGDNTANELLIQETEIGERTYILPLGNIVKNETRSFSILGMTTGDTAGFPDARAWLEYENASGMHIVEAKSGVKAQSKQNTAATANSQGNGLLPSSIFGWLMYALVIVGAFIGIRKGKEYFERRKEEIALEESMQQTTLGRLGSESNSPQGV